MELKPESSFNFYELKCGPSEFDDEYSRHKYFNQTKLGQQARIEIERSRNEEEEAKEVVATH